MGTAYRPAWWSTGSSCRKWRLSATPVRQSCLRQWFYRTTSCGRQREEMKTEDYLLGALSGPAGGRVLKTMAGSDSSLAAHGRPAHCSRQVVFSCSSQTFTNPEVP